MHGAQYWKTNAKQSWQISAEDANDAAQKEKKNTGGTWEEVVR